MKTIKEKAQEIYPVEEKAECYTAFIEGGEYGAIYGKGGITQVEKFAYYMYNKWNANEAKVVFGENLGSYIYNEKWAYERDSLTFFMSLDTECRHKLVERAEQVYG